MKATKTLLSIAVIVALPFAAHAENISGAMYTAPAHYDTNHPAPTTSADPLYGRVNIDTADQEHIATTAYVKGAYNSAIAAVNKVTEFAIETAVEETMKVVDQQQYASYRDLDYKQDRLEYEEGANGGGYVVGSGNFLDALRDNDIENNYYDGFYDSSLISAKAVAEGILSQRVDIYTTWDSNATTQVALSTAQ